MNCYICEKTTPAFTLRYGIAHAVGVCQDCGIGVCLNHSRKDAEPGSPLLCPECAEKRAALPTIPRQAGVRLAMEQDPTLRVATYHKAP
jgi:hypothetical protein